MPRSQSAHALVNAGFLYKVNDQNILQQSRIVYGGLSPNYIRATALERYLIGKKLFENETLKTGITKLRGDLIVDEDPVNSSVEFRTQLALNLFYKIQCSGEAKFTEVIPTLPNEVFIEFALSTVATGNIISINAKKALSIPGVIAFYTAKDIPGLNSFTPAGTIFYVTDEEILCNGQVKYYNQPIGVIVAESRAIAERAARIVETTYSGTKQPVLDIKKAKKDSTRNILLKSTDATDRGNDVTKVIHQVGCEVSSDVTLLDYIRNVAELRGTKYMCREGGCGACIVSAIKYPGATPQAVNSCLVSITSCHDWDITTVEEIGNRLKGYNVIQTTLADHNGTQCGYCTPGWITAMYSLLKSKGNLTKLEIEKSFGSNICRCTGYRPILEAFKRFGIDATDSIKLADIEDLDHTCNKNCTKEECESFEWCLVTKEDLRSSIELVLKDGKKWFKVYHVAEIFQVLLKEGDDSYMLVAGNTAKGAYPIHDYPRILIDIASVAELKGHYIDQNLVIGSGNTLTEVLDIFQVMCKVEYFGYLQKFYEHLDLVAHIPVRNIGTIAGNLMIKHQHNDFASDIFLLLETVGAQIAVEFKQGNIHLLTMQQFLNTDMRFAVILNVLLPPLSVEYEIVTFKIMPRAQNAHAIVNAGFLYKLDSTGIVFEARIVYGGLSPDFVRAEATEAYLRGKLLFRNETLRMAIGVMESELIVVENPPEPSAKYRKQLAINLFYKGLLTLYPQYKLSERYRTGAIKIKQCRPVSNGTQIFETNPALWPLNKPIPKIEALIQCSGEAPYTEDQEKIPKEVYGAFVLSTIPKGNIISIDPSVALMQPGVIAFYTAAEIPGLNSFVPDDTIKTITNEEILCSGQVLFYNQPLAIVVAESRHIAVKAAELVHVQYANVSAPIIDIKVAKRDQQRNFLYYSNKATDRGNEIDITLKNELNIYAQYHFTMETLVCITKPNEHGMEVKAATQWMDCVQVMISRALKIDENRIDVEVRRCGGAYGAKVSRISQVALASSLVTYKLNLPCRFIIPLTTNMRAIGKRFPCSTDFEVGVNQSGVIQFLNINTYEDNGCFINEVLTFLALDSYFNCYDNTRWNFSVFNTITDTAKNSWCRAPVTLENVASTETYMECISYALSMDPVEVRLANVDRVKFPDIIQMVNDLKIKADYDARKVSVEKFNKENRWKKRGLRTAFLKWTLSNQAYYNAILSVFHGDGSVSITHSGIEIGQGVHTKIVQIAAYILKIPIEKIKIKVNDTNITPNSTPSAASYTSQYTGLAVQKCCEKLLAKLEPIRKQLGNPSWELLIATAYKNGVDLQTRGFVGPQDNVTYDVFGVTFAEVEIDVLTGEYEILRVDLNEDVGISVSPEIDVGQVEGAFIMGLGYWTTEHLVYNEHTGELLTDRTWNYHVPQARDIPQDFRVYFRKKSSGPPAVLGSKTTGEPAVCMAVVVPFAIREALVAARLESGIPPTKWFDIDGPYTVEQICLACENNYTDYKFY